MLPRLFATLLAVALPAAAQETLVVLSPPATHPDDRTRIDVEALFSMAPPGGYLPVRVVAVNQRKTPGSLTLSIESHAGEDSGVDSTFTLDAPEGKSTTRDFIVPLVTALADNGGNAGSNLNLRINGAFGFQSGSLVSNFQPNAPAVLLSEKLYTPNSGELDKEVNSRSSSYYGSHSFAARFEPSRMPEDWRAYSGYDVMILTDEDWSKLAPGARTAILQWIRLGSRLEIHRLSGSPANFSSLGIDTTGTDPAQETAPFGFGTVHLATVGTDFKLAAGSLVTRIFKDVSSLSSSIETDYSRSAWPLHLKFGGRAFSYALFIVVLIAFAVLVGPVNLFVFAKSGKRHKLFITTPIISLATCGVLILLILVNDGIGGRGERIALIEVRPDSGENKAYVLQEQVSRTGVLLGSTMTIREDAAINPVPIAPSPWARLTPGSAGSGMRFTTNLSSEGLVSSGDWFQSRSEQGQLIRAVVPTRGRIEAREGGGPPVLVSTFDFPIARLYYTDRSGGHWTAENLEAGKPVTCNPMIEADFNTAWEAQALTLGQRHRQFLRSVRTDRDRYLALSTSAPAIETLDSIRWTETQTLLTGPAFR
ncbi:MAG: hypothetical protein MUF31_15510 [Akkermansiaceae bacterium]|jgi:hypothetical protein|nr:hypothetical protein [Akkermansiaceae bacterium]